MSEFNVIKHAAGVSWRWLYIGEDALRVTSIAIMTLLVFVAIMLRVILGWGSPAWDEIARYLMIWSIMAGAVVTSREDEHIKMGFLRSLFHSERKLLIFDFIILVITTLFLCGFVVWAYQFLLWSFEQGLHTIVTDIPMAPMHVAFLFGAFFSVLHFIVHVIKKGQQLFSYHKTGASC